MKSNSADPDFVRMSLFRVAMEAWLRSISSVDDGRIGLDRGWGAASRRRRAGLSSGRVGMKSPRSRMVSQRVPDQRIGSPHDLQEAGVGSLATPGPEATSTNSLPPATYIGRGVVSCQKESPRGFMASVIICA